MAYSKTYTLIQHTPIVHFQHDQTGATLRGSELKPKLDRFLRDQGAASAMPPGESLPYKLRIEAVGRQTPQDPPQRHPLYFGDTGRFDKSNSVQVRVLCFDPKLLTAIDTHFAAFLANHNFGTRQGKGFGSFSLANTTFNTRLIVPAGGSKVYRFSSSQSQWAKDIALVYGLLRGGINRPDFTNPRTGVKQSGFYAKSLMFMYAKGKDWKWDKKAIKNQYFAAQLHSQQVKHGHPDILTFNPKPEYLMRDLLGLATHQTWGRNHEQYGGASITKRHAAGDIERFPSPLFFKPVGGNGNQITVYFWVKQHNKDVLNASFLNQSFEVMKNGGTSFHINTPPVFDIDDYLATSLATNLTSHIDARSLRHPDVERLLHLFTEISTP